MSQLKAVIVLLQSTQHILEVTAELKGAMANTGSPDLRHINRACIRLL